jgi:type II secretory pathway pseudopilin PulG
MKTTGKIDITVHGRRAAFTLVEILMAMFVFGLVVTGVLAVLLSTLRSIGATSEMADINGRLRLVQERLLFDLRSIESVTDLKERGTATVDGTPIQVYREFSAKVFERGAAVDALAVPVTYRVEGDAIIRVDTAHPTGVKVLSGIKDAWFQFFPRKGTTSRVTTDDALQVKAIQVSFIPKKTGSCGLNGVQPSSSALVQLRNPSFK